MTVIPWDETAGGTPRGTLVVLPGRGETAAPYQRFGGRLSADAYRVRLLPVGAASGTALVALLAGELA